MTTNITRDDIAEFINQEFGLTKKDCNELVKDIIEEIRKGLIKPKKGEWIIQKNNQILEKFDKEEDAKDFKNEGEAVSCTI